jgi:hypothetical protein
MTLGPLLFATSYKVISKIMASRIKDKLANCISIEQFAFLKDRLIFYVVGITKSASIWLS